MPTKSTRKSRRSSKKTSRTRPTKSRVRSPRLRPDTALQQYATLVAEPCYGPLVRSVGGTIGTSLIERVRGNITQAKSNGYVVWFPSYSSDVTLGAAQNPTSFTNYNLLHFEADVSTAGPVNLSATPLGLGATPAAANGRFLQDPTAPILQLGSPFTRAKALAACISMEYLGAMQSTAGLTCCVANIAYDALFINPNLDCLSIDQVFNYAAERGRVNIEGSELRWCPTEASSILRTRGTEGSSASIAGGSNMPDTVFWSGSATTTASAKSCVDPNSCVGIIFAWKGVPASSMNLNFTKVVELELAPVGNSIEEPRGPTHTALKGGVAAVTELLDSAIPGWQTAASEMTRGAMHTAARAAIRAFTFPSRSAPMISGPRQYLRIKDGDL